MLITHPLKPACLLLHFEDRRNNEGSRKEHETSEFQMSTTLRNTGMLVKHNSTIMYIHWHLHYYMYMYAHLFSVLNYRSIRTCTWNMYM